MVQLDNDEELGRLHGMYGSMEAEFEAQRTIKRAELTTFLCLLKRVIGPIKVHVDNQGIIVGSWRGERNCIDPRAGDADFWMPRGIFIVVEQEHVKAHLTKKGKKKMSQI